MSSSRIPKEQLTAYQRWELASFDEPSPAEKAAAALADQVKKATEEARNASYAAGMEEGRAAGFEQGKAQGFEQGYADGLAQGRAQADQERTQLLQIAQVFSDEIAQANEKIASDILDLALDLSKAMLKSALHVRPELVIPIIGEAVRYLPSLQQPALLFLHPEDAKLACTLMGEELTTAGWRIVEDAAMERGGCRVDTASNQVDATATSRWQRIAAALGKDSDWLAP
ncbi:flagellar assembly protein FliH [Noviherbaspirillum autotrophicum]|uniref:Flagellar assembly protein FliH n=1 Tax=Noviherbaspirillum autotrophicum TaxID=709839 RepID=A0A0C1YNH1_9BURK|nr:flagellar assembly protein FliH [Noviherbaspirillum autotrophicum]KIF82147.1 flagellar assembly protein FliH [Noviherbaspirillum autotrophicum]